MLPRFVVALPQDSLLQSTPPFDFPNVSMRVFPIRADMTRVQSLVDSWVNAMLPPEAGYFRAFTPFVALVALNYGRAAVIPSNLGWSSQHEVTFSIPLQWYKLREGAYSFHDFAVLSPYIFVDNELSVPAGREVFGWQKVLIWPDPLANRWMQNPRAPVKHAGMTTLAFREVYAGKQQQRIPFIEIEEGPAGTLLQYPADRQNPHLPWVALHNVIDAASETAQDLWNLLIGLGIAQRRRAPLPGGRKTWLDPDPDSLTTMLETLAARLDPYSVERYTNQINVKQFRDTERPTLACYQEVNNTVMRVVEVNRMGFLGEARILSGDLSGGYRISLHQLGSLPIAEMLGLEGKRSSDPSSTGASSIRPVLPMWADMDLVYAEERHVLAWRSKDAGWTLGNRASSLRRIAHSKTDSLPFNTALGSSSPVLYGPFETPGMTIRALPLLARKDKLQEVLNTALNEPLRDLESAERKGVAGFSFEPWGSYVYLLICTSDSTYSVSNNVGSWPSATARFAIPVVVRKDGEPDGFALYCPFAFSASSLDTTAGAELHGTRVMGAKIESPESTWMQDCGPAVGHERTFAVISAMIPPILNAGERAEMRALIRIDLRSTDPLKADKSPVDVRWPLKIKGELEKRPRHAGPTASREGHQLFEDLVLGRARSIDFIADQKAFRFISLKQFRDVARPDRACYQALVEVEQRLLSVERIEEIKYPLDIHIVEYESMPIVRMLGLEPRSVQHQDGMRVHVLEPIRPFWGRAHHREELGKNLAVQERDLLWARQDVRDGERDGLRQAIKMAETAQDGERLANLRSIDLGEPEGIGQKVALRRGTSPKEGREAAISFAFAPDRDLALARLEPQWVIESLLSREWEGHAHPVWRRRQQQIAERIHNASRHHSSFTERARVRLFELADERNRLSSSHHPDILDIIDRRLLPRYLMLSWVLSEARHLDEIAQSSIVTAPQSGTQFTLKQARSFYAQDELSKLARALSERRPGLLEQADALVLTDGRIKGIIARGISLVGGQAAVILLVAYNRFLQTKEIDVLTLGPALNQVFGGGEIALPEGLLEDLRETRSLTICRLGVFVAWHGTLSSGRPESKREWTSFLRDVTKEADHAREELILALAKCSQKPFFCVRRDTAGSAELSDLVFPKADCWKEREGDDLWYSIPAEPEPVAESNENVEQSYILGPD